LLRQHLDAPVDGSPWADFVAWADGLWTDLCGGVAAWQADEAPFAEDVHRTLLELSQADVFERQAGTSLALFLVILEDALEGNARPVGSLGQGVLVGPVQSVTGLAFERVYIVGMTEGAFPTPPSADPFFPSAAEDPLHLRERQRRAERLAFRTALAAADNGRVTLSVPDSILGRKAFPSPWLLELASAPSGIRPLFTTAFQALRGDAHPEWLRVVTSAVSGIAGAPPLSDLEDRRLRESGATDRLALHAMAARADLRLGAGLALSEARRSSDFTPFDGNTDVAVQLADAGRVLAAAQRVSASGIEAWATCPFRFFLGRVLRVDATDRPEDGWTVDPLERGSLVHRILERFFQHLRAAGRFEGLDAYSSADHHLLEQLATECFADLERRGVTGHPLVWESTSAAIRTDLRTFLIRDERWRRERRLQPRFFEQAFGMHRSDSWPPLELDIGGVRVSFRGSIDRVDLDPSGRRAYLYDYKTGSTTAYGDLNDDPVMGGKHIQLALYRRALLAAIPDVEEADGAYWFVTSKGDFKMLPAETPPDTDRRLSQVLEGTVQGVLSGAFPQVPGAETARPGVFSWDNCVYCDYDRVCPAGRDAVWERKQHSPGYRAHSQLAGPASDPADA
jgi:RecB family exonuclease